MSIARGLAWLSDVLYYYYRRSVLPMPRFPVLRCLGLKSGMCLSASPLRAVCDILPRCTRALRTMPAALLFWSVSRKPRPGWAAVTTADTPRLRERLRERARLSSRVPLPRSPAAIERDRERDKDRVRPRLS